MQTKLYLDFLKLCGSIISKQGESAMSKSSQLSTDNVLAVIKEDFGNEDTQYNVLENPGIWEANKNSYQEEQAFCQKNLEVLSKVPLRDIWIATPADFREDYTEDVTFEVLYLNTDKLLNSISDEQLLNLLKSQLATDSIELQEGDGWYYGETTILSYDPDTHNFEVAYDEWQDYGTEEDEWHGGTERFSSDNIVPAQELIDYLRKRNFGSIESEKTFKESLKVLLKDYLAG